jgi:hypothetical protein
MPGYKRLRTTLFAKAFYLHDQWIVLHRRNLAALLDRSALAQFARVFGADEHYIMKPAMTIRPALGKLVA